MTRLIGLGFENVVALERIVAIITADAAPSKRLKDDARRRHKLIDATNGRKTRALIITDSDHVILASAHPATLAQRLDAAPRPSG